MEAYSMDLRKRVVRACRGGMEVTQAARQFHVDRSTVHRWLRLERQGGSLVPRNQHVGRPRQLTPAHEQRLCELVAQQPDATLSELRTALKLAVTGETVRLAVLRLKLTRKKRR